MRLINADEIESLFNAQIERGATDLFDAFEDALQDAQTVDAVPVVRCKDCKYADTERRNATEKRYYNEILICRNANLCEDEPLAMWPDDFCSYGERKDGAD